MVALVISPGVWKTHTIPQSVHSFKNKNCDPLCTDKKQNVRKEKAIETEALVLSAIHMPYLVDF